MGHSINPDRSYRLLQKRLDRNVTGAPYSPTFMKILALLFSPEEAELARFIPSRPTRLKSLAGGLDMSEEELGGKLGEMARRGVMVDLEIKGERYFFLPPIVIGFFEFTFMRTRDDVPLAELAKLFDQYMRENDRFARAVFDGDTQIGRTLVHEEALSESDYTEILDWERASRLVDSASTVAVGICQCRHKASHLGTVCDAPQRNCLSLNYAAANLVRNGTAEKITNHEGLRILEESKQAGLAQTGDNVQRNVTYICNCCGCCCEMIQAIRMFDIRNAIVTSNWRMEVDTDKCRGCGLCVGACPVDAIELVEQGDGASQSQTAQCDETLCLGCGVCYSACRFGAISMTSRPQRVYTPETAFDRIASMAIERGKLANVIFDDPTRLSYRAFGRLMGLLENSPPFKAAMAIKPLRSKFLETVVKGAKSKAGTLRKTVE